MSIAREVVILSDKSGVSGARTYTVCWDDQRWEVDLTEDEAQPIVELARLGRQNTDTGSGRGARSLESRIRNVPPSSET